MRDSMASEDDLDITDELTRLMGKSEDFEAREELRNLLGLLIFMNLLVLLNLILILIYPEGGNYGCAVPGILINIAFIITVAMFFILGPRFASEMEDENDYDPDVLFLIDKEKAKKISLLFFVLALSMSAGAVACGFIFKDGHFLTYPSILHFIAILVMFFLTNKTMSENDAFEVIRE